ncbi:hypothetical protein OK074_5947 [Actinobacteria bacterium OK074]|nr:hypothetical protein OK074_5947 [Actinobacteria bacterium OK074]
MTTLTTSPAADVLERLFADAERTRTEFRAQLREHRGRRDRPPGERAPGRRGDDDWRSFFSAAKHVHLAVSRETGNLLYVLARSRGARAVVEFGTSFGVSTLCLAAALRDNGGGRLIGTEFEPTKAEAARRTLTEAGLGDLVEIRDGDAVDSLGQDLPTPVDLLFLDGAKSLYADVLRLVEPALAPGALVVADNAGQSPDFLEHVRTGGSYVSSDVGHDVEVAVYTAG